MPLAERILHPTKLRKRAETEAMVQGRSNLELKERLGDSVSASEHPKPLIFLALICDSTVVFYFKGYTYALETLEYGGCGCRRVS